MLKIEVKEQAHTRREIRAGVVYEQKAYAWLNGEPYPKEIRVSQWVNRETGEVPNAYPVGYYTLGPDSFVVGKYNELLVRPNLVPLEKAKAA